jgi:hypothetical protein
MAMSFRCNEKLMRNDNSTKFSIKHVLPAVFSNNLVGSFCNFCIIFPSNSAWFSNFPKISSLLTDLIKLVNLMIFQAEVYENLFQFCYKF